MEQQSQLVGDEAGATGRILDDPAKRAHQNPIFGNLTLGPRGVSMAVDPVRMLHLGS